MSSSKRFGYTKTGPETYKVEHDGESVGTIYKAWTRNGGEGWTASGVTTYKTRDEAARDLLFRTRRAAAK